MSNNRKMIESVLEHTVDKIICSGEQPLIPPSSQSTELAAAQPLAPLMPLLLMTAGCQRGRGFLPSVIEKVKTCLRPP